MALRITWAKTIIYPALYVLAYGILLLKGENPFVFYTCYGCMGILTTMIVFNIVHDAIHNSLFAKPSQNKKAMLLLDFLGGSSFIWSKRHVVLHHGFTNIPGWDIDIQQSAVVRFNDKQSFRKFNRYQFLYMPFIYLIYSLNWLLHRDFKDFFQRSSMIRQHINIPYIEYVKLFVSKFFYITYIFVIPFMLLPHSAGSIIAGILFMHALMSALTMLVLLPSHLDEHAQFPEADENMLVQNSWAIHQMKVTNDFGIDSRILNFIMGGLNHHIAHHLFPNVNHNIIPKITRRIYETAQEHNLPYKSFSFGEVMTSH